MTTPQRNSDHLTNSHQSYSAAVLVGREHIWLDLHYFNLRCTVGQSAVELEIESRRQKEKNNTYETHTTEYTHPVSKYLLAFSFPQEIW